VVPSSGRVQWRTVIREERRAPLNRARVIDAAIELADREGLDSVSMRKLGQVLGVEAMSLYTHVRGKDDLLDGMIETVVAQLPGPADGPDWLTSLRATILGSRAVLLRHPWAPRVIERQVAPRPAMLQYVNAVAGIMRTGGLSIELTHHAMHVLGSRILGFTQDLYSDSGDIPADPTAMARALAAFPWVAEIATAASHEGGLGGCDDDIEFAFGLDLILEGLEHRRLVHSASPQA
jgi:AcrR family transcriptional regulator